MESADPQPLLPGLKLDELLDELQVRLQAVLSTRDRVHSLLEAVVGPRCRSSTPGTARWA